MTQIRSQQINHVLGSDATVTLVTAQNFTLPFEALWKQIARFEDRFSRFKAESELSKINAKAGKITRISKAMHNLLKATIAMQADSSGLYDPFILPALQRAGYIGSWPHPKQYITSTDYRDRQNASLHQIVLTNSTVTIPPGTALDFGGIGKGYLLDNLAARLIRQGVANFWISLGGDIITHGFDLNDKPWEISIQDVASAIPLAARTIRNTTGALLAITTSGTVKRKGEDWHHIIDPRTGRPAITSVLAATTVGPSAMKSEIAAKLLVITDADDARNIMQTFAVTQVIAQKDNRDIVEVL